jgi:transcriptional regulator with XRE-family HTH domain
MQMHNLAMPTTTNEKLAFSDRLKLALRRAPGKPEGPTELARFFNLRYLGDPVSTQTVDKWLKGRTIPKLDKLETLAKALRVDLHWLRYGPPPKGTAPKKKPKPVPPPQEKYPASSESLELATKIESLTPHHRYLVQELVEQFYGDMEDD